MFESLNKQAIAVLKQEVGDETIVMLFDVFAEELSNYAQSLSSSPSVTETQDICHALKSSARSFGADSLADLAIDCEAKAKAGCDIAVIDRLPCLQQTVSQMADCYRQLSQDQTLLDGLF
jgi:two-component system phosphorelay protein LuxU